MSPKDLPGDNSENDVWVFGYGSLVWKQNFDYDAEVVGCIRGFRRRFWLSSEDHRGVPGKPGRVVTVMPSEDPEDQVWGVAYRIPLDVVGKTFDYLNRRERNGYTLERMTFYPQDENVLPFEISLYVTLSEENPHFVGPASVDEMAKQICTCKGPSGTNLEYFLRLSSFMKQSVPEVKDNHINELDRAVRKLISSRG